MSARAWQARNGCPDCRQDRADRLYARRALCQRGWVLTLKGIPRHSHAGHGRG